MRTWRLVIDLAVFALVAAGLVAYGIVDLLGDPLRPTTEISAVFPDVSGVSDNFTVWLNGVDVGEVSGVRLVHKGADVQMRINPGVRVPDDVVASIDIANDLGEQVVELTPSHGGKAPPLRSGAVVGVRKGGIPAQVSAVVASASALLRAIPSGDLNHLLRELAKGLKGRSSDLRTIVADSTTFSRQILQYQDQIDSLLADAPPVLDTVAGVGPQLAQALANSRAILEVLAQDRTAVQGDLANGSSAVGALQTVLTREEPNLACVIHDVSDLAANLDQPTNLGNLSSSLSLNQYFFGALTASAQPGAVRGLASGGAEKDQTTLRTRLLLPPTSPAGDAYPAQSPIPDILPAAGCTTEFGQGVGAASQPGFAAAAGGTVVAPTAADARVRGGGDGDAPTLPASAAAAQRSPVPSPAPGLLTTGCIVVPALALAWGARPSRPPGPTAGMSVAAVLVIERAAHGWVQEGMERRLP